MKKYYRIQYAIAMAGIYYSDIGANSIDNAILIFKNRHDCHPNQNNGKFLKGCKIEISEIIETFIKEIKL